jgi:hypothetical protein
MSKIYEEIDFWVGLKWPPTLQYPVRWVRENFMIVSIVNMIVLRLDHPTFWRGSSEAENPHEKTKRASSNRGRETQRQQQLRTPPAETHNSSIHMATKERTVLTELQEASKHAPSKENRMNELRHARELLDGLLARGTSGDPKEDLKEYAEVLSIVVHSLSAMEMHDRVNTSVDCGTAVTATETVVSSESSPHVVEHVDDSYEVLYEEAGRDDDYSWTYAETKRFHKRRFAEGRNVAGGNEEDQNEADDDDIIVIDETEFTQGLSGYEEGFYPRRCDTISEEDFECHSVGFGDSPKSGRGERKAATSVRSEGSQCFYCLKHGDGENCKGTKFCM